MTKDIETKRTELLQFIKTVGAPHIWSTYNFYLKEVGCPDLVPDGPKSTSPQAGGPAHKEPGFKQLKLTSDKLIGYYRNHE